MDWRLDSLSGSNGSAPGGVICGEAYPAFLGQQALAGGGAGYHNNIPLHTICRKHVVVTNGRVMDRGFLINEGAMTLEASFTIPNVGKTVVLGYGGVKRRRPLRPAARLDAYGDDPFPTPDGVSFGSHPYSELGYIPTYNTTAIYKDRRFMTYSNHNIMPLFANNVTSALFIRVDAYHFLRYDLVTTDNGSSIPAERYTVGVRVSRVNILNRHAYVIAEDLDPTGIRTSGVNIHPVTRLFSAFKKKAFPVNAGTFIMFPHYKWAPHVKIDIDNPLNFVVIPNSYVSGTDLGEDFWALGNLATSYYIENSNVIRTNRPFRLFDGRYLVLPRHKTDSTMMYILDPSTMTIDIKDPYALGLFLSGTNGGTSKWKAPVQIPSGTVMALPDVFPGNYSLFYHPDEDRFETRIAASYPRPDIAHTIGQPTADGRIIYAQTYGAAADINSFLIVWPDEDVGPDTRFEIVALDGLVKSVVGSFDYGLTVGDGTMVFSVSEYGARANWNTTSYYTKMALDPVTMDFELYKYPAVNSTGSAISNVGYRNLDDTIHNQQSIVITPEFDYITFADTKYDVYTMFDAPATKSMGAFLRQAYFGYCF